jgi:hypothetical protein
VTIISPAIGGPNVLKLAKKALNAATSAQKTAKAASATANQALGRASQAPTVAGITVALGPDNAVAPGGAGSSIAFCPAGQRVISGGGHFITGQGNGMSSSQANNDRSAWFVVGGNTAVISGDVQAVAYCAGAGQAVASRGHTAAKQQVAAEVARVQAQLNSRK